VSVPTADGIKETTKLERLGARAERYKEAVFSTIGHALDIELLKESYQPLNGKKAVGIEGVSKGEYGKALEENLQNLLTRIRNNAYKPKASKWVEIPKEDGSVRPLALSCFEDKGVQQAVTTLLKKVFEPTFLSCS